MQTRSRYEGCLLGGAVGDALGAPVEFMRLAEIRERYGEDGIADFDEAYGRVGAITDDTQMTLFTAEGMLRAHARSRDRGLCDPHWVLCGAYVRWLRTQGATSGISGHWREGWLVGVRELHARRAPGSTCLSALRGERPGRPDDRLNDSKGCGGVMRVAPVGLSAVHDPFEMGCVSAAITHGHPTGWLAAGFLAQTVAALVQGEPLRAAAEAPLGGCGWRSRSSARSRPATTSSAGCGWP